MMSREELTYAGTRSAECMWLMTSNENEMRVELVPKVMNELQTSMLGSDVFGMARNS